MFRICTICTLLIDPNRECIRIHSESSFHHNHRDLRLAQNRRLFQPQRSGTFTKVVASAISSFGKQPKGKELPLKIRYMSFSYLFVN